MPAFQVDLELQAFARVECFVQYRISGSFRDRNNWVVDDVEVPGQAGQHNWIRITRLHPFWAAYETYMQTSAFDRDVDQAIAAEIVDDFEEAA